MKKIGALLLLLVPLVLAGCTKEVTDYDLTIVDDTITYTGKYTGTLEDGNAVGEAKYVVKIDDTSNWVYQGTFVDGKISGEGSVDKYPCTIRIGIHNNSGVYSGKVTDARPNGEGTFVAEDGWSYTGTFANGTVEGDGKITDYPYDLSYESKVAKGKYTGDMVNGIPSGTGQFSAETTDINIDYSGTWTDGDISGEGELKTNVYTIDFKEVSRTGQYEGSVIDGRASGTGKFTATNDSGITYTYEGDFDKGTYNGYGVVTYDSDEVTNYRGHMTNGECTPTKSELLVYLGTVKDFMSYSVNDASIKFIDEHDNLFMVENEEALEGKINEDIILNELYKTPGEHSDEIITFKTKKIIQIRQETVFDSVVTWFIVEDTDGNRVFVLCPGELPDVNKNDKVTVYGVPINMCSYQNSFNGTVSAFVIYGSHVKK
ncbi:hypothetical protein [Butyrivibrio sp. VCB2001]|uniref:hypothetical protein n=1 Tax=Butyrivibrio sp. VCB2001 TaxID=1280667 RepID=UPI00040C3813|nr:hypothetical protein [Butyrivibrio sp. VCB2001]